MSAWFALVESNTSGTGRLFARAARTLGYRPVVLAADPGRYRYVATDKIECVRLDTQSPATVLAACRDLADAGLAGISSSSEYYVETAALIARELGLPGPDPKAIRACRDKGLQRRTLAKAGVGTHLFREVTTSGAASEAAAEFGFPVVVKPVSGSGNVGVRVCATELDVREQAEKVLALTHNERGIPLPRKLLVEEYVSGPEFSVEVMSGRCVGVTRKHLSPPPFPVEIGHDYPGLPACADREALRFAALTATRALGLTWGAAHVEVRLAAGGPSIIEVNPRLAGGFIPELVRQSDGIDLIAELVAAATGREPMEHVACCRSASVRFLLAPENGQLASIQGVNRAQAMAGVVDAAIYPQQGASLIRRGDFRDRIGHVIACSDHQSNAIATAEAALAQLTVTIGGQK